MESVAAFFSMGGYAPYIWPSFGLSALVLAALFHTTLRALRRAEAELSRLESDRADLPDAEFPAGAAEGTKP